MNDDVRIGLVVGGAALMAIAVLWWWVNRTRRKRRLMHGLRSKDPQERARAGIRLVDLGLLRAARPLLDHVLDEPDARVRLALALAIARRQWEPSNTKRVGRLRDWASSELEKQGQAVAGFGPAVTRISDMGGPRPEETQPAAAPASPEPAAVPEDAEGWDEPAPPAPTPISFSADHPGVPEAPADPDGPIEWHPSGPP